MLAGKPNILAVSRKLSTVIATASNYPHCRLSQIPVTYVDAAGRSALTTITHPVVSGAGFATRATWLSAS